MSKNLPNFWHIDVKMKSAQAVINVSPIIQERLKNWKETGKFSRFFFTHYNQEVPYHIKIGVEGNKDTIKDEMLKLETEIKSKFLSDFDKIEEPQNVEFTDYGTGIPVDFIVCEAYTMLHILSYNSQFKFNHRNLSIILERFIHHLLNTLLVPPAKINDDLINGEFWVINKILHFKCGADKY